MSIEMSVSVSGISKAKNGLNGQFYRKAAKRSLNETGRAFRTKTVKDVREKYNIKARDIKRKTNTFLESDFGGGVFTWHMDVKGKTINLIHFGARQTRRGVTVKIRKDRGRKLLKGGFIERDSHGTQRVFMRKGKARLPISAKNTLSVPQMFREDIVERNMNEAKSKYPQRFKRNLDYYLGRAK